MAEIENIEIGTSPNDGQGDPLRVAFAKTNRNFDRLDQRVKTTPPETSVGNEGDQAGMYAYDENFFYYCYDDYDGTSFIWAKIAGSSF
jgi:hypothetical protein